MAATDKPIQFIAAKCPDCGGELRVPENRTQVKCMYCGHDILIHDQNKITVEVQSNIDNLLDLAITAHGNNNYPEAYEYYSRVLEEEPEHIIARYGKASCAGALSTLTNPRIQEMMDLFEECTNDCPEELKSQILPIAIKGIYNSLAIAYNGALEMYKEYIKDKNAWKYWTDISVDIKSGIKTFVDPLFGFIYEEYVDPDYRIRFYKLIIKIDSDIINGFTYTEQVWISTYGWDTETRHPRPNKEYREILLKEFNEYVSLLKKVAPNFVAPEIQEEKKGCFIATATMGNYDHPYVLILRNFRDNILEKKKLGLMFIEIYYKVSPCFAKLISKNKTAQLLCLVFIIRPSVYIANIINKDI